MEKEGYTSLRIKYETKYKLDSLKAKLNMDSESYDQFIQLLISSEYEIYSKLKEKYESELSEISSEIEKLKEIYETKKKFIEKLNKKLEVLKNSELLKLKSENMKLKTKIKELENQLFDYQQRCKEYENLFKNSTVFNIEEIKSILYDFYTTLLSYFLVKSRLIDKNQVLTLHDAELIKYLPTKENAINVINLLRKDFEKLEKATISDLVKTFADKVIKEKKVKEIISQ